MRNLDSRQKNSHRKKSLKGAFTLIETLLYIALVSILMLTVTNYWSTLIQTNNKTEEAIRYNSEADFLLASLTYYIRSASGITAPASGVTASSITLTYTDLTVSPTVISWAGSDITVTRGAGAATQLKSNHVSVSNLTFVNYSRPSTLGNIRIVLTLGNNQNYYASASLR